MKVPPRHRLRVFFIVAIIALLGSGLIPWSFARANEPLRTPENQVFQFVQRDTFTYAEGQTVKPAAYLWIPETCRRLRGLLILGQNVTEHTLVGHPAIRAACTANNLGIVWCTPSFFNTKSKDAAQPVAFLQRLLDGLAFTSGYEEVATVPWLPMGESGHLLMVDQLLDGAPARCIAGIYVKNAHYFAKNRTTPILVAVGTAQEWDQEKADILTRWQNLSFYGAIMKEHAAFPDWPVSLLIEGNSGHFDCTESMAHTFADYIIAAVRTRVPADLSQPLIPVDLHRGFVTGFALPGHEPLLPVAFNVARPEQRFLPWFFDAALAQAAYASAAINWRAATQIPVYLDGDGKPAPMLFRGITRPVPIETGADGVSFTVRGGLLPALPANFIGAGTPLAQVPGTPSIEWICGPVAPLGPDRFRIAVDRTWPQSPVCLAVRHAGTRDIRAAVQPGYIDFKPNSAGTAQTITFPAIGDQVVGTAFLPLAATVESNLPVEFFVVAGPAVVEQGRLRFTPLPPRTRLPVAVTVTAWQWGRSVAPAVQTAPTVTRSFSLTTKATEPFRRSQ